jgi:hypothetical protein
VRESLGRLDGLAGIRKLRDAYQALHVLGSAKEFTGEGCAGRLRGDDYSRFMEIRADRLAALEAFPRTATAAQQRRLDTAMITGRLKWSDIPPMAWWDSRRQQR